MCLGARRPEFAVGDRFTIDSLDELDPTFKKLMDDPVTQVLGIVGPSGRANLTPMWFDYEGDTAAVSPPSDPPTTAMSMFETAGSRARHITAGRRWRSG